MASEEKIKLHHLVKHETKREVFVKFSILIFVLIAYTGVLSWKYGFQDGGMIAVVTWSFFVLCTPVADAGFLLDFPLRLLFGIRMIFSEIIVWSIALLINIVLLLVHPAIYEKIIITRLFQKILTTPYPYWVIIFLSATGTFLSVQFGDELMDLVKHRHCEFQHKNRLKLHLIITIFLFVFVVLTYGHFIHELNIDIHSGLGGNLFL